MEFIVSEEWAGRALKDYLYSALRLSHAQVTELKKRETGMAVNGAPCHVRRILTAGDRLFLALEDERGSDGIVPLEKELEILFEDDDLIAVNKPPYMPTHPSLGHSDDTLANALAAYFMKKDKPFVFRAVNRLDRDTSGVVLAAKNKRASAALGAQIAERTVKKVYVAVLAGELPENRGTIDRRIVRAADSMIERRTDDLLGERAVTEYEVLERKNGMTLARAFPLTGRTHQLRVHFAYIGHPVIGDTLYGSASPYIGRQALHALLLTFLHPVKNESVTVFAPLQNDMISLLREAGFEKTVFEDQRRGDQQ